MRALSVAASFALALLSPSLASATANYVYHEQTTNALQAPTGTACGDYLPTTAPPTSSQTYPLEFKIEYQFYTDTAQVYFTTDGTAPGGSFGIATGTSTVLGGTYFCQLLDPLGTGMDDDAVTATIPPAPAGTVVKYVVSAWHTGGGPEVFANSGTCPTCTPCEDSSCATVFTYTVASPPDGGSDASSSDGGSGMSDAATEAGGEASSDAGEEASADGGSDAGVDASSDVTISDASSDASTDSNPLDATADSSPDVVIGVPDSSSDVQDSSLMHGDHEARPPFDASVGFDTGTGPGEAPSSSGCGCTIPGGETDLSFAIAPLYALVAFAARRRSKTTANQ
jgi:MYXO-CTERM domain-containing protein